MYDRYIWLDYQDENAMCYFVHFMSCPVQLYIIKLMHSAFSIYIISLVYMVK